MYIQKTGVYINAATQRVRVIEFLRFERGGRPIQAVKVARLYLPGGFETIDRDKFEREFKHVNEPLAAPVLGVLNAAR